MKASWFGMLLAVNLVAACGGDSDRAPHVPRPKPDGGSGSRGGEGGAGKGGRGGTGGGSGSDAPEVGPIIEFTSPQPASDPNSDELVTTREVSVDCHVTPRTNDSGVDGSSVAITLEDPRDPAKKIEAATNAQGEDIYQAKFIVADLPNGKLRFTCSAKDLASSPATNSAVLETFLDLGPKLMLTSPLDKAAVALKTPVTVRFQATPSPVAEGDEGAAVSDARLTVLGKVFEVRESSDTPGEYTATVDFEDKALFNPVPVAAEIILRASNSRMPGVVTRESRANIKVDGAGPSIEIRVPADGQIVPGRVELEVVITDTSGVKPGGVIARVTAGAKLYEYTNWTKTGDTYRLTFDTSEYQTAPNELTINIVAVDTVDNEATQGHFVRLDGQPPVLSLDPPWIREWRRNGDNVFCTIAFDSLADATDDGETVGPASTYRVRIEDETNVVVGAARYLSGVNESKVEIWVQGDPSIPLLIYNADNGGSDSVCNEINEKALSSAQRPTKRELAALLPRGVEWYPNSSVAFDSTNPMHMTTCPFDAAGGTASPPERLCPGTPMRRVIPAWVESKPPGIYAMNPTNGTSGECAGTTWNLLEIVGQGWACLAARAEDKVGNVGVSWPLRVCVDDPADGVTPCDEAQKPTCVQDCSPPPEPFPANYAFEQR